MSDPNEILRAIEKADDAFEGTGVANPEYENEIDTDEDWKTQLTKACKLVEVVDVLRETNGYHTAVIELCFGAIERSIESYVIWESDEGIENFQDHTYGYRRAHETGLFTEDTAEKIMNLYEDNRTDSYYGGRKPSDEQSEEMHNLATSIHAYVADQIREGGVCICG